MKGFVKLEVAQTLDEPTPLQCILQFKELLYQGIPLTPDDLKKRICEWIDENIFNLV